MNDITEYRRLKFFEALRFVLALAVCLGAIALLAFCHGCAAPPALPEGSYDFVTNSIQRAVTQLEKTRERDANDDSPSSPSSSVSSSTGEHEENGEGAQASSDSPSSPSSPVVLDFRYGGFKGDKAAEDPATQIKGFKFSSSGMGYSWAKGDLSNWGLARTDAGALACAFYEDPATGRWIGGKFDWISTSRTTRSWENIRGHYNGWDPDAFFAAKKHAFCIVSRDGKRRTNLITD